MSRKSTGKTSELPCSKRMNECDREDGGRQKLNRVGSGKHERAKAAWRPDLRESCFLQHEDAPWSILA